MPGESFGYDLELWRHRDQVIGLFVALVGQAGDPPVGLLEGVHYDPHTDRLSFRVRMSTGFVRAPDDKWLPTHEVFGFEGRLQSNKVAGVLTIRTLSSTTPPIIKRITLRRSQAVAELMEDKQTYEEWKKDMDLILSRLGPKW